MPSDAAVRWGALPAGVVAVSTSSILIRLTAAPPIVTAAHRMVWSAAILLALAGLTRRAELVGMSRRSFLLLALAGALLGAHFALWTAALFATSVASAVFLVDTHPILVGFFARWTLAETTKLTTWVGIGLTLVGGAIIAGGDSGAGASIVGDAMAVIAAAMFAGYLVIGRRARQGLSTVTYAGLVYGGAAALLLAATALSGAGLSPRSALDPLAWLGLVAVPTLGGHTVFNWTLRYLPASVVGVAILGEPVVATGLAWLILREQPPVTAIAGGCVVLVGLFIALR